MIGTPITTDLSSSLVVIYGESDDQMLVFLDGQTYQIDVSPPRDLDVWLAATIHCRAPTGLGVDVHMVYDGCWTAAVSPATPAEDRFPDGWGVERDPVGSSGGRSDAPAYSEIISVYPGAPMLITVTCYTAEACHAR